MPRANRRSRADAHLELADRFDAATALTRLADRDATSDLRRSIARVLEVANPTGISLQDATKRAVGCAMAAWHQTTIDFEEQQESEAGRGDRDALAVEAAALARRVREFANRVDASRQSRASDFHDLIRAERSPRSDLHLIETAIYFGARLEEFGGVVRPVGRPDYHSVRFRTSMHGWWQEITGRMVDRAPPDALVEVALDLWRFMGWEVTARTDDELGWMRGRLTG